MATIPTSTTCTMRKGEKFGHTTHKTQTYRQGTAAPLLTVTLLSPASSTSSSLS
ncbi:hypothetical protein JZ751_024055, partial [Albula glossodonta]